MTTPDEDIAGRSYARPYRVAGRADLHAFLIEAIESTGATVLHASPHTRAPFYFGVRTADDERIGALMYAFRCNPPPIKGRPADEHRVQIRYGSEETWQQVRLERQAASLGLDPPLRLRAAEAAFSRTSEADVPHALEERFDLDSREILDIVDRRLRLRVAVRGGVAEHHLHRYLRDHPDIAQVIPIDEDEEPDFEVVTVDGRRPRIECKNCSPDAYADGTPKVEVQKTRASKGDPASRFYEVGHFDLVAACMFSLTGRWEFRFARTQELDRHDDWPDRLKPIQRIDERWEHDFPHPGGRVD